MMDVRSACPLPAQGLVWQPRAGHWALTVVCKATFLLEPGEATLAAEQEPLNEEDNYWDDDPERSLYAASDIVPAKPRADILVVGNAYAPEGRPARSLVARVVVGDVDKSLEIVCDRSLDPSGVIHEGARFTKMRLVYERASGGHDTWNPVGVREGGADAYGRRALPNIQAAHDPGAAKGRAAPAGFGPIAPRWPLRRDKLGAYAASSFSASALRAQPLPDGFDASFFNVAPPDQQTAVLRGDERIVLENLHAAHPRLITRLPGLTPSVLVEAQGSAPWQLPVRADTLWIDTDRALCTLTWRGQVALDHPQKRGRVVVSLDTSSRGAGEDEEISADAEPIEIEASDAHTVAVSTLGAMRSASSPLPFASSGGAGARSREEARSTSAGLPFAPAPPAPAQAPPPPAPVQAPPPAPVQAPPPAPPAPVASAPWAAGSFRAGQAGFGAGAAGSAIDAAAASTDADEPSDGGAFAASTAAAGVPWDKRRPSLIDAAELGPGPIASASESGEALNLVWFDPESAPRVRRHPPFRSLLRDSEEEPLDAEADDPAFARDPTNVEDRREVFLVLARADVTDDLGVDEALGRSVRRDGKFVAPLLLVEGELALPFDEIDALRATALAASPYEGGDDRLKSAIADAEAFLRKSDMPVAPPIPEGLTLRIREAFAAGRRPISSSELDAYIERALATKRLYQKREILGGRRIRALLTLTGGKRPIPTYLPEAIARDLPMGSRFRARLLVEANFRIDPYEACAAAFKASAIGWLMPAPIAAQA